MGKTAQLVGDGLFVTNVEFLQKGVNLGLGKGTQARIAFPFGERGLKARHRFRTED